MSPRVRNTAMFGTFHVQTILHTSFVGMFMFCLYTKFLLPSFNSSLIISASPIASEHDCKAAV
jgi:hypothetical protein